MKFRNKEAQEVFDFLVTVTENHGIDEDKRVWFEDSAGNRDTWETKSEFTKWAKSVHCLLIVNDEL